MRLISLLPVAAALTPASAWSLLPRSWITESPTIFPRQASDTIISNSTGGTMINNSTGGTALPQSNASTFSIAFGPPKANFTFTLTSDYQGSLYFRMAGPSYWSWLAVGTGDKMDGSLMFIMYQDDNGKVTLSNRAAYSNSEPVYDKNLVVNFTSIPGLRGDTPNGIFSDRYIASGKCFKCAGATKNQIDITSTSQQFIYAVGPPKVAPYSSSLSAPLRRHLYWGHFTLDMTMTQGDTLPRLGDRNTAGTTTGIITHDRNYGEGTHGWLMVGTFLVLFPAGMIFIRAFEQTTYHVIFQSVGTLFVLIGAICGLLISHLYNRSKGFNSAHQIIGIITLVGVLVQSSIGFFHHRLYKLNSTGKPALIKAHKLFIGPLVFALGLVNGSLGLRLANAYTLNWIYLAFAFFVIILLFITSWKQAWFRRRYGTSRTANGGVFGGPPPPGYGGGFGGTPAASTAAAGGMGAGIGATAGGYSAASSRPYEESTPFGGDRSDIALHHMDAPPAYDGPAQKPREFA